MAGMAARLRVRQNTIELEDVTDMRTIKFRGRAMNRDFVYGLLTKKKIRSSGEIHWAIATGNCTAGETIPINENSIAQLVGYDANGEEIYEGDIVRNPRDGTRFKASMNHIYTVKIYEKEPQHDTTN